jgi:hypothetical protein
MNLAANHAGSVAPVGNRLATGCPGCVSPGPGGTFDNSPMLQHWVKQVHRSRPEGTAEIRLFSRPFGTNWCVREVPTLKRWAIVAHPSGMKARKC